MSDYSDNLKKLVISFHDNFKEIEDLLKPQKTKKISTGSNLSNINFSLNIFYRAQY